MASPGRSRHQQFFRVQRQSVSLEDRVACLDSESDLFRNVVGRANNRRAVRVVIELKAGEADRDAIGQVLAYMGDLTSDTHLFRGILVAGEFSARTVAAARVVPNLQLKKYSFKFAFEPVGPAVSTRKVASASSAVE